MPLSRAEKLRRAYLKARYLERLEANRQKRAAAAAASWEENLTRELHDEDDFERRCRTCGGRVIGYLLKNMGEVVRCEQGHDVESQGGWAVVRVRTTRQTLPAASIDDLPLVTL